MRTDLFNYPQLEVVAKAIYYANWRPRSDGSPRPIWENLVPEIREHIRRMAHNALFAALEFGTDASLIGPHMSLVSGEIKTPFTDHEYAQFDRSVDRRSQVDGELARV